MGPSTSITDAYCDLLTLFSRHLYAFCQLTALFLQLQERQKGKANLQIAPAIVSAKQISGGGQMLHSNRAGLDAPQVLREQCAQVSCWP